MLQDLMKRQQRKRPVGRPRLGKIKLIIYVEPEIKVLIDEKAKKAGLARSAYIVFLVRKS